MIELALVIAFVCILILAIAIGHVGGVIAGERQHRKAVVQEVRDERAALMDSMEKLQKLHNSVVSVQQSIDVRLSDAETRLNVVWQGIKR